METSNQLAPEAAMRVVGIGASAGGLESLEQLFAQIGENTNMAFVVIQHLSPDHKSMMDELLSRHSRMPICVVSHGIEVRPNHIYLLPPRKEMVISGGRLWLTEKDRMQSLTLPIDKFFRSLAEACGSHAMAVVLSGTGSDGSRGLCDVKRAGGTVLAENPDTAKFDGMPLSALATGMVDRTASADQLGRLIAGSVTDELESETAMDDDSPTATILRLLRAQWNIDFSFYKTSTVMRRIERRVNLIDSPDLSSYAARLSEDPNELNALYRDLLIGVTRFFRDPDCFEYLEERVVPRLLERTPRDSELRVWIAGCATGEEAYSVGMILYEAFVKAERPLNVKILATDVHRASLETASRGIYGEEQMVHVSEKRRRRFFTKRADRYQVSPDLRQLIVFAPHNLTKDAPFTRMQLITCRNFLIYLEPAAQHSVLSLFHFGLVQGGYLFLGSSESPGTLASEFSTIDERRKFFRKRRDVRLVEPRTLAISGSPLAATASPPAKLSTHSDARLLSIYDRLLDSWMPPGFLIDEDRSLLDTFAGAERWLHLNRRRPSGDLLDLMGGELRAIAAGAIQQALKSHAPVRFTEVTLPDQKGELCRYTLCAEPLSNIRGGTTPLLLTLVPTGPAEVRSRERSMATEDLDVESVSSARLQTLEGELSYARETLQATVEELQTSNEQLQATNEELVASNEELQSTNEELHSVNEELYTVNAEHQKKIEELRELNADMQHLLEGTAIGTLFLDSELRIRKFTPKIESIFHIQPQDLGRSVGDFSHNLRRDELLEELGHALTHGTVIEDEVRDTDGGIYFLRILPYRPATDPETEGTENGDEARAIDGVVLTLTDISALEQARARLAQLSAIVESSDDAIIGTDRSGLVTSWNGAAQRLYGYSADEILGRPITLLAGPEQHEKMSELLQRTAEGSCVERTQDQHHTKEGGLIDVSVTMSPIRTPDGEIVGTSAISRDITELKRAQNQLEARGRRIELLLDSTAEGICGFDTQGVCIFCNRAAARLLRLESTNALLGQRLDSLLRPHAPDGVPYGEHTFPVYNVLRTGEQHHSDSDWIERADGTRFQAEYWTHPIRNEGAIVGAVLTFLDVTDRKHAEEEIRVASERREQFLAMLSHELRNPLAAVLSATRVLQEGAADECVAEKARGVINRQAKHMASLLEDLLDVSRITRGGIQLKVEVVDLKRILALSIEALAPFLEEREANVEMNLPDEELLVDGDPARLQQIAVNLLSNAVRYSPPRANVVVEVDVETDHCVLRVRDQGSGISAKMLPHIFELFVQSDQGLERAQGGLGIGLTLVKKIVELHGGKVEAHSDGVDKGSTFTVRLPRSTEMRARSDASPPSQPVARTILVVEDQPDAREMLTLLLQAHGDQVFGAADGPTALEILERERPDAALIDIGLPTMSGYDLARKVRENSALASVCLIALTGYGTQGDVRQAREAGFDHHLTKPADPDDIQRLLKTIRPVPN